MKILIADDNKDLVASLRERLQVEGFTIIEAYEGVRVVEAAHRQRPDLILLDIQMPVGMGRDVLEALRSKEDTKKIPIIVITGLEQHGLEQRMLAEGANGFLKKPFEVAHLLGKIRSLVIPRE